MKTILIIGDSILDHYISGSVNRISPESPVPILEKQSTQTFLGGASNVFSILRTNKISTQLITSFNIKDCNSFSDVINIPVSKTTTKTRIVSANQQIVRIDDEEYQPISFEDIKYKIEQIGIHNFEYVILSDYSKGVLHESEKLVDYLKSKNKKIIVDPKKPLKNYMGSYIIKCNRNEYDKFFEANCSDYTIVTDGGNGSKLLENNFKVESKKVDVCDVTGAGDSYIAFLALSLNSGKTLEESMIIADTAATESVKHSGNYIPKLENIIEKKIFTNGCFDVLHLGHIRLLNYCKTLGNVIIGLNSDESVKRLKGNGRPINNQENRRKILEELGYEVLIFEEDTPLSLIQKIKPAVIVKGGDYKPEEVVGKEFAEIKIFNYMNDYSTTNLIKNIKSSR